VLSEYYWKDEDRTKQIISKQPIQHLGQPKEIADVAVLLAGEGGSYLTGQTIVVDGGSVLTSRTL
jgi:NAD(P)-dependent dehydrogenase (short-subunit alcohol dehydrogenase family)